MPDPVEVYMIQQDESDCTNTTVKPDPDRIMGTLTISRSGGFTQVDVLTNTHPGKHYNFNLKCVRKLGDIVTDDDGIGKASFRFPNDIVGPVFAFDMHEEPAKAGEIYQSLTVTMK